jgi:hypothetical protein
VLVPHLILFDVLTRIPSRSCDNWHTASEAFIYVHRKDCLADKSIDAGRKPDIPIVDIIRNLPKIDKSHDVNASVEAIFGDFLSELVYFW